VVVEAQQGPALAGSSQATAVEIPDDDAPPPGWDQWVSLPTPAPTPQAGALVRRWDGHMVHGGHRHGAEASSSRAAPCLGREARRRAAPPLRRRSGGAATVGRAPRSRRLAQPSAERGVADPRRPDVACFPGKMLLLFPLISSFPCLFLAARRSLVPCRCFRPATY
jgi:hypothetical protein